ncbi:unnamed protein product [Dicrocoelium dendriticum]|nr:unnamed protein product [Dicrocoelium dendriticum]
MKMKLLRRRLSLLHWRLDDRLADFHSLKGVDLSNIVKDMVKYKNGHPCTISLKELCDLLEADSPDYSRINSVVENLREQSDINFSHRKLLHTMGVLSSLETVIDRCVYVNQRPCVVSTLRLTASVCSGQAEVFNSPSGAEFLNKLVNLLIKTLHEKEHDDLSFETISAFYSVLRTACLKNEPNRLLITGTAIISETIGWLSQIDLSSNASHLSEKCAVLRELFAFLRSITLDDDMEVEFGMGSANARDIASTKSAIEVLIKVARASVELSNEQCVMDAFTTLASIITREEFCRQFTQHGGLNLVLSTLQTHRDSPLIVFGCLQLLRILCGSDDCKRALGTWSSGPGKECTGPTILVELLERFIRNTGLVKSAAAVIAAMTLRQPDLAEHVVAAGVPEFLAKALQLHMSDSSTVRAVCMAIRNCVARSADLRKAFMGSHFPPGSSHYTQSSEEASDPYELESLLNTALAKRDCADEAKAALRDLGCRVTLRELWTGVPAANS